MNAVRAETQQDRCSDQNHLWRQRTIYGFTHMACRCGAVHPTDLDPFMDAYLDACWSKS